MKKSILTLLLLMAVSVGSWAIRPMHKAFPHKQSDGTTIMAYLHGDGFEAYYTSLDGKVLMRTPGGHDLCYATMQDGKLVASTLIAHEATARTADELSFLSANPIDAESSEVRQLAVNQDKVARMLKQPARSLGTSTSDGLGKYGTRSGGDVPSIGAITIPVIMVQFSDKKFQTTTTPELMSRVYNEPGYTDRMGSIGSIKDYFVSQSDSMFIPTFDIIGPVTLDNGYATYGANRSTGGDSNVRQMVRDAVSKAVDLGVDFSKYYVDNHVPLVALLYAGPGEATGGGDDTVWPHFLSLTSSWGGFNSYTTMSNYQFGSYFVGNETLEQSYSDGTTVSYLMGMGVFVHEFGHALGLPDFYVTDYSYSNDAPFGDWSVMDEGEYYGSAYAPVGYNAYEKSYMGWLDISELTTGQQKTLKPGEATLIRNANSTNEYFILENRQPSTWYPSAMGSGLLNIRIAYDSRQWTSNTLNNTQSSKRAMVVTADSATISSSAEANQANLYGNGTTNMLQFALIDGTTQTTTPVYRIVKHDDGTITLNFIDRAGNNAVKGNQLYYKITDASQISAGDTIIFVNEAEGMAMGKAGNSNGRIGVDLWIEDGTAYATNDVQPVVYRQGNGFIALQLSSSTYLAQSGTTALRTLPNSRFRTTNDYKGSLSFSDGNALLQFQGTGTPYMSFDANGYDFNCSPETTTTLQIYSRKKPTATGIKVVNAKTSTDDTIYTLTGQKVSRQDMRHGVYIIGGRKVVVK